MQEIKLREIVSFANQEEFHDLLLDRLHGAIHRVLDIEEGDYTMFMVTIPRGHDVEINPFLQQEQLIYGGVDAQRRLLELGITNKNTAASWEYLKHEEFFTEETYLTRNTFNELEAGQYSIEDIPVKFSGDLYDYFADQRDNIPQDPQAPASLKEAEYWILREHFEFDTRLSDKFLSLPLIQYLEFDGVLHFIYKRKHSRNVFPQGLKDISVIKKLIREFNNLYDEIILDWDIESGNFQKREIVDNILLYSNDPAFQERKNRNPILRELRYLEYYQNHFHYYKRRVEYGRQVPALFYERYLLQAIVHILIDSYAHNVSAHSLVALNWYFQLRSEYYGQDAHQRDAIWGSYKSRLLSAVDNGAGWRRDMADWIEDQIFERKVSDDENLHDMVSQHPLVLYSGRLDKEIHVLLKFMLEKGAFWSGVTRDIHFGGKIIGLYSLLWNDFINNPLYLGTIARSEGIERINLKITIFEPEAAASRNKGAYHNPKRILQEGILATVDLRRIRSKDAASNGGGEAEYLILPDGQKLYYEDHPSLKNRSVFVEPGANYTELKAALKLVRMFFPGDLVGKHAFLTILENEIRNVKHYKGEALRQMHTEGLTLNISIQETSVKPGAGARELYKTGIWLEVPTVLKKGRDSEMAPLITRKFNALRGDVMNSTEGEFLPRLGGNYQDKICAAMLFNNRFASVQKGDTGTSRSKNEDTDRDRAYYPWLVPASCPLPASSGLHDDVELNLREARTIYGHFDRRKAAEIEPMAKAYLETFVETYDHEIGYIKKYFFVWKGENLYRHHEGTDLAWENIGRFRFVSVPGKSPKAFESVRRQGVVRILESKELHPDDSPTQTYHRWLKKWLGDEKQVVLLQKDNNIDDGMFVYNPAQAEALHYYNMQETMDYLQGNGRPVKTTHLRYAHRVDSDTDQERISYRSNGILKTYFVDPAYRAEKGISLGHIPSERQAELFETLTTKVCMFDNRIWHRIKDLGRTDIYRDMLHLVVHKEETPGQAGMEGFQNLWEYEKQHAIRNCHFLVLHLSYIERILEEKYAGHPDYTEGGNIQLFLEQELLPVLTNPETGKIRDNFILVITTGRGRISWWKEIEQKYPHYTSFIMFRTVESLISSIENAVGMKDDIELKFRLVKVLFGA